MELYEIINILKKIHIEYRVDYLEDCSPRVYLFCCQLGENNGWDYGEEEPTEFDYSNIPEKYRYILDDEKVCVLGCDWCCGCGGW